MNETLFCTLEKVKPVYVFMGLRFPPLCQQEVVRPFEYLRHQKARLCVTFWNLYTGTSCMTLLAGRKVDFKRRFALLIVLAALSSFPIK